MSDKTDDPKFRVQCRECNTFFDVSYPPPPADTLVCNYCYEEETMTEEVLPCPECGAKEKEIDVIDIEFVPEGVKSKRAAVRYCLHCGFFCHYRGWNNLPRETNNE